MLMSYPVVTFPAPEPAKPLQDLSGITRSHLTLPLDNEVAINRLSSSNSVSTQPNGATFTSPLVTEPTSMFPEETIVPDPVHEGEKSGTWTVDTQGSTPPPSYGDYSSEPGGRSHEINFVHAAVQAWDWNAPEPVSLVIPLIIW